MVLGPHPFNPGIRYRHLKNSKREKKSLTIENGPISACTQQLRNSLGPGWVHRSVQVGVGLRPLRVEDLGLRVQGLGVGAATRP